MADENTYKATVKQQLAYPVNAVEIIRQSSSEIDLTVGLSGCQKLTTTLETTTVSETTTAAETTTVATTTIQSSTPQALTKATTTTVASTTKQPGEIQRKCKNTLHNSISKKTMTVIQLNSSIIY